MKKLFLIALFLCFAGNAMADNPGKAASNCVTATNGELDANNKRTVTFTNVCAEKVFVIWCGDLAYSKKQCGDGPRGGFYTQSVNIGPGQSSETKVNNGGGYNFAACYGGISFGSDEYTDKPNGNFTCVATGRYKNGS